MSEYLYRTKLLIGEEGIEKLKHSTVLIVGLGGVGSYASEAIARAGIGNIAIIDFDCVDISNINRQIPALHSTIGKYKSDIMEERISDINPMTNITKHTMQYRAESSEKIFNTENKYNYVIDAIDSISDKIHLIKTCINNKIPIISSMGMANRLDPQKIKIDDISKTNTCPMARKIRRELLSKENIKSGLKVVFSNEKPHKLIDNNETSLGSISFVPSVAGLLMASKVINDILSNQ